MNCDQFQELIGMRCNQIGEAVEVITPFSFADGDAIEIFAQTHGPQVLFFDDGFTLEHLNSIGIGAPYKHGTRRVFPKKFPFSIVCRELAAELVILAIAPFPRMPAYWQSRECVKQS